MNLTAIPADLEAKFGSDITGLDVSHNMLTSLDGIAHLTKLTSLNLDFNFLTEHAVFPSFPQLDTLTLNKNRISDIDSIIASLAKVESRAVFVSLFIHATRNST